VSDFLPGYEASAWLGVGVPKDSPVEIVDKLNKEINAGLADIKKTTRLVECAAVVPDRDAARLTLARRLETLAFILLPSDMMSDLVSAIERLKVVQPELTPLLGRALRLLNLERFVPQRCDFLKLSGF
jgi:hypothetical protein